MRVLCAPDSFKETIDAGTAAAALAAGARSAGPSINAEACPVADGGEGTIDVLVAALGGVIRRADVTGPRGGRVRARFGIVEDGRLGIVELAEASGLAQLPPRERDPEQTTTYGTGELIRRAVDAGCERVLVGLGGSATCDGAAGIAQALGATFFDGAGRAIAPPITASALESVDGWTPPAMVPTLVVAFDVRNPLLGPRGAAATYGPQKGAAPAQVIALERGLARLAARVGGDPSAPGAGAAGGAGFGLAAMLGASLRPGAEVVLDAIGFAARLHGATLVLTGEGRLDAQSIEGKACGAVASAASAAGVPVIALVGTIGPGAEACLETARGPLTAHASLTERYGADRARKETGPLLEALAREVVRRSIAQASDGLA